MIVALCRRNCNLNSRRHRCCYGGYAEPDGATADCISLNVMVFKHGRITIPPALGPAAGASARRPRREPRYVGAPWDARAYRGGWRAVPEGSKRWWDEAMNVNGRENRIDGHVRKVRASGSAWSLEGEGTLVLRCGFHSFWYLYCGSLHWILWDAFLYIEQTLRTA